MAARHSVRCCSPRRQSAIQIIVCHCTLQCPLRQSVPNQPRSTAAAPPIVFCGQTICSRAAIAVRWDQCIPMVPATTSISMAPRITPHNSPPRTRLISPPSSPPMFRPVTPPMVPRVRPPTTPPLIPRLDPPPSPLAIPRVTPRTTLRFSRVTNPPPIPRLDPPPCPLAIPRVTPLSLPRTSPRWNPRCFPLRCPRSSRWTPTKKLRSSR